MNMILSEINTKHHNIVNLVRNVQDETTTKSKHFLSSAEHTKVRFSSRIALTNHIQIFSHGLLSDQKEVLVLFSLL